MELAHRAADETTKIASWANDVIRKGFTHDSAFGGARHVRQLTTKKICFYKTGFKRYSLFE